MKLLFLRLYLAAAMVHLFYLAQGNEQVETITKYLLMPFLLLHVIANRRNAIKKMMPVLLALFFCWAGDAFLLYTGRDEKYFLLGLASFLIGHLFYVQAFTRVREKGETLFQRKKLVFALPVIYAAGLLILIIPSLGDMLIPVILYAVVISWMLLSAMNREGLTSSYSFGFVLSGAVLFVLSDSLIAINKFYSPLALAPVLIMSTYIIGQYLIVTGILLHDSREAVA